MILGLAVILYFPFVHSIDGSMTYWTLRDEISNETIPCETEPYLKKSYQWFLSNVKTLNESFMTANNKYDWNAVYRLYDRPRPQEFIFNRTTANECLFTVRTLEMNLNGYGNDLKRYFERLCERYPSLIPSNITLHCCCVLKELLFLYELVVVF
eukprot:370639_1